MVLERFYDTGGQVPEGMVMEVYLCNFCSFYHLGKTTIKRAKK